jgi:hypothetical protein
MSNSKVQTATAAPPEPHIVKIKPGTSLNPEPPQAAPKSANHNYPLTVYPPALQEFILACKPANGIPIEYGAAMALFAASSALGKRRRGRLKQYDSPFMGTFWGAIVGPPNIVKSGTMKLFYRPLVEQDKDSYKQYKLLNDEFRRVENLSKKERAEEGMSSDDLNRPPYKRTTIKDTTWEKLVDCLQDNPEGLTAYRDELAGWIKEMTRYQGADMENWLSSWSGDDVTKDRVSSGSVRVDEPYLSVVGGIQPGILSLIGAGAKSANGFIDRMLFVWPNGLKKSEFKNITLDYGLTEKYKRAINRIKSLDMPEDEESGIYSFSPEALKEYISFFNKDNTPLCNEAQADGKSILAGMLGKHDVYLSRFALILHVLNWAYTNEREPADTISAATVEDAIKVTKYFRQQASKVFHALKTETEYDRLPPARQALYVALPDSFKTGEGVLIASKHDAPERTFKDWLRTGSGLFTKARHGVWEKSCEV